MKKETFFQINSLLAINLPSMANWIVESNGTSGLSSKMGGMASSTVSSLTSSFSSSPQK